MGQLSHLADADDAFLFFVLFFFFYLESNEDVSDEFDNEGFWVWVHLRFMLFFFLFENSVGPVSSSKPVGLVSISKSVGHVSSSESVGRVIISQYFCRVSGLFSVGRIG